MCVYFSLSIIRVARSFKDYSLSHNPLCLSQKRFARKASAEASSKTGVASSTSLPVADVPAAENYPVMLSSGCIPFTTVECCAYEYIFNIYIYTLHSWHYTTHTLRPSHPMEYNVYSIFKDQNNKKI